MEDVQRPPRTLQEAEELRQRLTLEVQGIQAQLGDKQRTHEDGSRLSSTEYWRWKKKAQYALNQKLDALREVKAWIRSNRGSGSMYEAIGHLESLVEILGTVRSPAVDAAREFLNRVKSKRD